MLDQVDRLERAHNLSQSRHISLFTDATDTKTTVQSDTESDNVVRLSTSSDQERLIKNQAFPKISRFFLLFFSTRPSDEYDTAPSRNYSRPLISFR